jgi:YD repeat-containing protein
MKKSTFTCFAFLMLAGLISCKKETSPGTAAASNCKITDMLTSGSSDLQAADPYTYTTTEKIDYNSKNLMSGYTNQTSSLFKSKKTSSYSSSNNYQYDDNGFLIKQISQTSNTDKTGASGTSTYTAIYEYTNGRLTKSTSTGVSSTGGKIVNSTGTITYEYTTDGKLSKYLSVYAATDGTSNNSFTLFEYTNGKVSKYSYNSGSTIITPLFEVNSQGYLTKTVTSNDESRFTYDAEGNRVRQERWYNGKKSDIRIYTLDSKQNVSAQLYKPFKGHPDYSFFYGHSNYSTFTHNVIKDETIDVDNAGVERPSYTWTYSYQYNGNNLPTASDMTLIDVNGKASQQYSKSYTYTGCQ